MDTPRDWDRNVGWSASQGSYKVVVSLDFPRKVAHSRKHRYILRQIADVQTDSDCIGMLSIRSIIADEPANDLVSSP